LWELSAFVIRRHLSVDFAIGMNAWLAARHWQEKTPCFHALFDEYPDRTSTAPMCLFLAANVRIKNEKKKE
jgi:hypothetical protein